MEMSFLKVLYIFMRIFLFLLIDAEIQNDSIMFEIKAIISVLFSFN